MGEPVRMWTIYYDPLDHPGRYVVRGWSVLPSGSEPDKACVVIETLEGARAAVPEGLVRLPREDTDDRSVVESWL